jgi:catechol-2,3-dioxygenase
MMAPDKELKVKSPCSLAHVVLRTGNYRKMVAFYKDFLGADITFMNQNLAFLSYDEEHHRIAIITVPGTGPKVPTSAGLEHIAFAFSSLSDLVLAYQQRKAKGMLPNWCVNHGPTTSIYYSDPDGNRLETQVDNFDIVEEANHFMTGKCFAENPIGTDFEPEDLVRRIESGESEESIKRRIEIGPRDLPEGF